MRRGLPLSELTFLERFYEDYVRYEVHLHGGKFPDDDESEDEETPWEAETIQGDLT